MNENAIANKIGEMVVGLLAGTGVRNVTFTVLNQIFDFALRFEVTVNRQHYVAVVIIDKMHIKRLMLPYDQNFVDAQRFANALSGAPMLTPEQEWSQFISHEDMDKLGVTLARQVLYQLENFRHERLRSEE